VTGEGRKRSHIKTKYEQMLKELNSETLDSSHQLQKLMSNNNSARKEESKGKSDKKEKAPSKGMGNPSKT